MKLKNFNNQRTVKWRKAAHLKKFFPLGQRQHHGLSFLDLPGEVRDKVYEYALDTSLYRTSYYSHRFYPSTQRDDGFKLLCLCRQVGSEAGELFINKATAYIPILADCDFPKTILALSKNHESFISGHSITTLSALADVRDLHLHLHVDGLCSYRESLLLKTILSNLKLLSAGNNGIRELWSGKQRNITLHLDHFFADDWSVDMPQTGCSIFNIVTHMGKKKDIMWTIRYYIHTGHEKGWVPDEHWHSKRLREFNNLMAWSQLYSNITIRPEIYGLGNWEELDWPESWRNAKTTKITLQSKMWSYYPEELHGWDRAGERQAYRIRNRELV